MLIGYARVSTLEQTLALQKDALKAAGCEITFEDIISGAKADRPGLQKALDYMRKGDTLVVWKMDRMGRSLKDLMELMAKLQAREIEFKSLTEQLDTTTAGGRLIFHLFASLAEFERDLIRERTLAGLTAARARGHKGGRPKRLANIPAAKIQEAKKLYDAGVSIDVLCKMLGGISRTTFYRHVVAGDTQAAQLEQSESPAHKN